MRERNVRFFYHEQYITDGRTLYNVPSINKSVISLQRQAMLV
jgi:hypothetical protein